MSVILFVYSPLSENSFSNFNIQLNIPMLKQSNNNDINIHILLQYFQIFH